MFKAEYIQIGKHFDTRNGDNLACRHCQTMLINPDVIRQYQMLDEFREWFNRPMAINSGYRCKTYNASIGGAKDSKHVEGIATDWALPEEFFALTPARKRSFMNNCRDKWFKLCSKYGVSGGVGFYDTFMHFDSRTGARAHWNESKYF